MQGNQKVIDALNELLAEELTAINQYMVHSEMCDSWGYERLHTAIEKTAIDEMKHAEKLIARILFLDGRPIVSELKAINIGGDVKAMIANDAAAELRAVEIYNVAIRLCHELRDGGTRELLEDILEDEERHLDWRETQRDQITQMGLENYLNVQAK
jgi:bacterioferritin